MVLFYITWAPWKSLMLSVNMGHLTSSRSPHRGATEVVAMFTPLLASPAPCPREQWGWAAKAPGWEVTASHRAARFGGRSHGLYCTEPKAGLLLPPAILAGNLSKRRLRGIASSKTHLSQPFFFFFLSSFFFIFLFHIERDRTVWKINCTGLRVTCVRACERLCTGSLLDFTAVAFILGSEAAT